MISNAHITVEVIARPAHHKANLSWDDWADHLTSASQLFRFVFLAFTLATWGLWGVQNQSPILWLILGAERIIQVTTASFLAEAELDAASTSALCLGGDMAL